MSVINSSNKYFEFYELIHQVKLTKEDRASPFITIGSLGEWNTDYRRVGNFLRNTHYDLQQTYKIYEEKIEPLRPLIAIAKKDKIYVKLFSPPLLKDQINEYINSLVIKKGHKIYNEDEFIEYLKFSFLADISFIFGFYFNEVETKKNNINTHGKIRTEYIVQLKRYFGHIHNLIACDNENNGYGTSDFKPQLTAQRDKIIRNLKELKVIENTKNNYPKRMLIARLSHYIFSNYGMYVINHAPLIDLFITYIDIDEGDTLSSETINTTIKRVRIITSNNYMRVPKSLRKGKNTWTAGFKIKSKSEREAEAKAKAKAEAEALAEEEDGKKKKKKKKKKEIPIIARDHWNLNTAKDVLSSLKL